MRLIEEYPDGVTEAIVMTELMVLLQRRIYSSATSGNSNSNNRRTVRGVEDMTRVLSELEEQDDAISARLVSFDGHKLSIQADKNSDLRLEMYEYYYYYMYRCCNSIDIVLLIGTSTSAFARAQRS